MRQGGQFARVVKRPGQRALPPGALMTDLPRQDAGFAFGVCVILAGLVVLIAWALS